MTKEILDKLEQAFMSWFTDEEASLYADIHIDTLYKYCQKNPKFSIRKELLKRKPWMQAKLNIVNSINGWDLTDSKWRAERKMRDEFSLRQETTWKDWDPIKTQNTNVTIDATNLDWEEIDNKLQDILGK